MVFVKVDVVSVVLDGFEGSFLEFGCVVRLFRSSLVG